MSNTNGDYDEYFRFLDALRASGQINLFGAAIPLRDVYPELSESKAKQVVSHWMESNRNRHAEG